MEALQQLPAHATPVSRPAYWRFAWLALAAIMVIAPLWHVHVMDRMLLLSHNDLIGRWLGTREALHGKDPYSPAVTRELEMAFYGPAMLQPGAHISDQAFNYPAQLVILLAPLAALPWKAAALTFLALIIPLLALSFWACARFVDLPLTRSRTALVVLLCLASWPVVFALRLLQPTLLAAVLVFLGCFLLSRKRPVPAGILLALATFKPQLVFLLLAFLLLWAVLQRIWSFLASFGITLAILLLGSEAIVPGWFPHWLAALHRFQTSYGTVPLEPVLGHWLGRAITFLILGLSGWALWQMRHTSARSAEFALGVATILAATDCANYALPIMNYNHILLIPGCLILVFSKGSAHHYADLARRLALATVAWGFAAVPIAVLGESLSQPSPYWDILPFLNPLLSALVAVALLLRTPWAFARARARRPAAALETVNG